MQKVISKKQKEETVFVPVVGTTQKKINLRLDQSGESQELIVVFAGKDHDLIDLDLTSLHKAPSTYGKIIVRGILRDQAVAKVRGMIKIEKKAQKSDGFLEERTILVGEAAKVETSPNLEIKADDVRAGHAAATGMINEEQMFYLRSRGLTEVQATSVLIEGFLEQVAKNRGNKVASGIEEVKNYALG